MDKFFKYQGTGNDFVMIDNRKGHFNIDQKRIARICHRRFGVGADGLILIENADGFDFRMRYFNADGAEGSMCGNGGRCAVKFTSDLGIFKSNTRFIAVDGSHYATINGTQVTLEMQPFQGITELEEGYFTNTGSPHLVIFKSDINQVKVNEEGATHRYSEYWLAKGGTNVNFVEVVDNQTIKVRTYERGVEDETYSCGTGVTAASLIAHKIRNLIPPINVQTLGGHLKVSWSENFSRLSLSGSAEFIFEGILNL